MRKLLNRVIAGVMVFSLGVSAVWWLSPYVQGETARITNLIASNVTNGSVRSLAVAIMDTSGSQITSFGGTSQIQDGDAAGEADVLNSEPTGSEYGLVVRPVGLSLDCDQSATISDSASGDSEIIPLATGEDIIVCHVFLASGSTTANDVRLVYGTGSNCASGQTGLMGVVTIDLDGGIPGMDLTAAGGLYFIPTSNSVCLETSASQQVSGSITFVQYDATP